MPILRFPDRDCPFTQVPNHIIDDLRLTPKALGVLVRMLRKPDYWEFSVQQLAQAQGVGKAVIEAVSKELQGLGYLDIAKQRTDGKFTGHTWTLYTNPYPENRVTAPYPEKPDLENRVTVDGQEPCGSADEVGHLPQPEKPDPGNRVTNTKTVKPKNKPKPKPLSEFADQSHRVMTHLNTQTGRHYRQDKYILARLREGYTPDDLCLVVDFLHVVRRREDPAWCDRYLDNVTPFRAENCDKFLARAQRWQDGGRHVNGTSPHSGHRIGNYANGKYCHDCKVDV